MTGMLDSWAISMVAKLGRCARCIRLSVGLMLGFISLLIVAKAMGAGPGIALLIAIPAAAFSIWSAAHGVAYVLRGPGRSTGCRSCAKNARAYRRAQRRRRPAAWLGGRPLARTASDAAAPCRSCGRKTPLKEMSAAPPASEGMRHVVEASPEFQRLTPHLLSSDPSDTWEADMLHYFLYDLRPDAAGRESHAVFITRWEDDVPLSAVIITPSLDGTMVQTADLRAAREGVSGTQA